MPSLNFFELVRSGFYHQRFSGFLRLHDGSDIAFRQGKEQIDRMRLGDHHDPGGITTGDLVTNINLLETNATIDWCGDAAPVELQLRAGDACFISLNGAFGFTDQRLLGIQLLTGYEIGFCQLLITRQSRRALASVALSLPVGPGLVLMQL